MLSRAQRRVLRLIATEGPITSQELGDRLYPGIENAGNRRARASQVVGAINSHLPDIIVVKTGQRHLPHGYMLGPQAKAMLEEIRRSDDSPSGPA